MPTNKIPVSGIKERETAPAENLNAENSERFVNRASSNKPQAPSVKHQASSPKRFQKINRGVEPQAASLKRQATSNKLRDSWTTVQVVRKTFLGPRAKGPN